MTVSHVLSGSVVGGGGGWGDLTGDIHWRGDSYVNDRSGKGRVVTASASQGAACTTESSALQQGGGGVGGVTSKAQTALRQNGDKGEKLTGGSVLLQPRCCGKQKIRGDKLPEMK